MQGRNQFQGGVPSNMNFPTDTYVQAHSQAYRDVGQAYAKAAEIESQAKAKMVGDLTQGALAGFGAYQKGVAAEKNFTAGRAMVSSPYFQKILGMSEADAAQYGSYLDKVKDDQGVETANKMMDSQFGGILKYAQAAKEFENAKEIQRLKNQGAMDAAGVRIGGSGGSVGGFSLRNSTQQ